MKIGILTYHRSYNYGAVLQAIALRKVLLDMGHEVSFIDYWPAYHRHMYALFSFHWLMSRKGIKGKMKYLKSSIQNYAYNKVKKENFEKFISVYIIPYLSSMNETYDVIVHGSDQIWRKQPEINTYNPVLFGKHQIKALKKISYAASMGILPEKESDKNTIKGLLSNMDRISVRERELFDLLQAIGFKEARQDLDPTLLLASKDWEDMFGLKKRELPEKYVLYYKIKDSFDVSSLRQFAKSRGLALKIIYSRAVGKETDSRITTSNPEQFLDLIYNADFVFTSSFHGLAFSLIFHKPFLASFTNNSGRAASLLETLDLSDHLILPKVEIPDQISVIDYKKVDSIINKMSICSKEYLYHLL